MASDRPQVSNLRERPLPRGITIRRGIAEDEYATFDVMRRSMGYEMSWTHHATTRAHLRSDPHVSYWVAEEAPRFGSPKIVGYARSLVRERVWMLTEFFVLSGHHRRGIGGALLARCLEDGEQMGADTRLVLASQHPSADSLYVRKAGCIPRLPMLLMAGPLMHLKTPQDAQISLREAGSSIPTVATAGALESTETLFAEPIVLTPEIQNTLDVLDRQIVGYARPQEHWHWTGMMGGPNGASRLFRRGTGGEGTRAPGEIVGYAYIGPYESGPALASDPRYLPFMLAYVATMSQRSGQSDSPIGMVNSPDQYWAIAGTNEVVLRWLLECGWQIVFQYLFMSTRALGQPERYVCHNPLYFL